MNTKILKTLTVVAVASKTIDRLAYDSETKTCWVKFKDGTVYENKDMDPGVWKAWISSDSIGRFFNKYVRKTHEYRRVSGDQLTFTL